MAFPWHHPCLLTPYNPVGIIWWGHAFSDGSGAQGISEAGSFGEGTGGVSALLFEAYWSNRVLAIWWRAPVKPCYPV